jgi:hypothetical protein
MGSFKHQNTSNRVLLLLGAAGLLTVGLGSPCSFGADPEAGAASEKIQRAPVKVSWFKKTFGRFTWAEVIESSSSPKQLNWHVGHQVHYKCDKAEEGDHWQDAKHTWKRRRGDCEDFAVLMVRLCEEKGIKARVECFVSGGIGHAIAIGEWNGQLWVSSNGEYAVLKDHEAVMRWAASYLQVDGSTMGCYFLSGERLNEKICAGHWDGHNVALARK